jgi:hypothetical protein
MQRIAFARGGHHLAVFVEKFVSVRDDTGIWNARVYFSVTNLTGQGIRIININAEERGIRTRNSAALTVGIRDGINLTIKDSLIDSGKYYDIDPGQQQALVGTLNIARWTQVPTNNTDGDFSVLFTIALDYYGIYNDLRCLLRVCAPFVFYFKCERQQTPIEGRLLCFDARARLIPDGANEAPVIHDSIIHDVRTIISTINNCGYVLSEPEQRHRREMKDRHSINLDLIAKVRAAAGRGATSSIRILFLAAEPNDAVKLRVGEELREIHEKLQLSKLRTHFKIEQRMSVRPADLSQALLDVRPTVVHFAGHGTAAGGLVVESVLGGTHLIEPDALAALFEHFADHVRCVVLSACYSSVQAKAIARHIDYVVGMSAEIGDAAAIAFAIGFYQGLGSGRSVEDAYKLGCVQIGLKGIPEHLTPVLVKKGAGE